MRSRVMPGSSPTIARRCPVIRLKRVDLPTLGRPTMTTVGVTSGMPLIIAGRIIALRERDRGLAGKERASRRILGLATRAGLPASAHERPQENPLECATAALPAADTSARSGSP